MELNRREFITLAAAGAANLVAGHCGVNSNRRSHSDAGESPDLEEPDNSSDFGIGDADAASPDSSRPRPTDPCLGEPVDEIKSITTASLQEIYNQAEEILEKALNILQNATDHQEVVQRGGGGPILPDKTVKASFEDGTVTIRSNDQDFNLHIYSDSVHYPDYDPEQLSLHRESYGDEEDVYEQIFYITMDPGIYLPTRKITHVCLPDQPTMLQEITVNEIGQRAPHEPVEIPSNEYFRLVIYFRDRIKEIMDEFGIDVQ